MKAAHIGIQKRLTSYPAFKKEFVHDYFYEESNVVVDGTLITSRGPGTAFEFALQIVEVLVSAEKSDLLKQEMLLL